MKSQKSITKALIVCAGFFVLPLICSCSSSDSDVSANDPCSESVMADGDLDNLPRLIKTLEPEYPYNAKKESWEGSVRIRLIINSDGTVCSATIITGSGRNDVDSSVLKAAQQWVYEPGEINGDPVRSEVVTAVRFELDS